MIFSNKIYKIASGKNSSLYATDKHNLILYTADKSLKKYRISLNSNMNCVFLDEYNYNKIIQLSPTIICIAGNSYISKQDIDEN